MESAGLLRLRWQGKDYEVPAPVPGSMGSASAHSIVSKRLSIPQHRLKLIIKGKNYGADDTAALLEHQRLSGLPVMVVGTASEDQLDSIPRQVAAGKASALEAFTSLPGLLWGLIYAAWSFIWLFVSSCFMKHQRPQIIEEQERNLHQPEF